MRLLSFLLAILMLALSCFPCSDAKAIAVERAVHSSHSEEEHNDAAHSDLCSPFCHCACCSVACTVPIAYIPIPEPQLLPVSPSFTLQLQAKPVGVSIPVWQPPRLV